MSILTPLSLYTQNISRDGDAEGTTAPEVFSEVPFQTCDRLARAIVSRATAGLSPAAVSLAITDWAMHLTLSPGKQLDLVCQAAGGAIGNLAFAAWSASGVDEDPCGLALPQDRRFRGPLWRAPPFNLYAHNFLSIERWWETATTMVRGVSTHHEGVATFAMR